MEIGILFFHQVWHIFYPSSSLAVHNHLSKKKENMLRNYLCMHLQSRFICISPNQEEKYFPNMQPKVNGKINHAYVIFMLPSILTLKQKTKNKQKPIETFNSMNKSLRHYSEWKKPDTKENPLYYSIYVMFKDTQKQSVIIARMSLGEGKGWLQSNKAKLFGRINIFCFDHRSGTR